MTEWLEGKISKEQHKYLVELIRTMGKQKLLEFLVAIIRAHGDMITTDEAIKAICEEIDKYAIIERRYD